MRIWLPTAGQDSNRWPLPCPSIKKTINNLYAKYNTPYLRRYYAKDFFNEPQAEYCLRSTLIFGSAIEISISLIPTMGISEGRLISPFNLTYSGRFFPGRLRLNSLSYDVYSQKKKKGCALFSFEVLCQNKLAIVVVGSPQDYTTSTVTCFGR